MGRLRAGLEWASGPPACDDGAGEDGDQRRKKPHLIRGRGPATGEARPDPSGGPRPEQAAAREAASTASRTDAPVADVKIDAELAALEAAFVTLDAPGDSPERIALLDRLATVYARLGRRREAGLCFARGVWDAPFAESPARLDAWIAAEGGLAGDHAFATILAQGSPDLDDVRVIAALAARAPDDARAAGPAATRSALAELVCDPHRVQRWLDDHDGELDSGTLWLARVGLARLGGAIHAVAATDLERVLQHSLRALRRTGLRDEIAELLAEAEHARSASESWAHRAHPWRARRRRRATRSGRGLGYRRAIHVSRAWPARQRVA